MTQAYSRAGTTLRALRTAKATLRRRLRDVQRLLGHGDIATTQRYLGRSRSAADRPAVDMGLASVVTGFLAPVLPLRRRG